MVHLSRNVTSISHDGIHMATKIFQQHLHQNTLSGMGVEVRSILREIHSPLLPIVFHPTKEVSPTFNPL